MSEKYLSPEQSSAKRQARAERAAADFLKARELAAAAGITWIPIKISPKDMQFLEARTLQMEELTRACRRMCRLPAHFLDDLRREGSYRSRRQEIGECH